MHDAARSQEGPSLAGVRIALAGRLAGMPRREALQLIREHGGIVLDKPDSTADLLVISDELTPVGTRLPHALRGEGIVNESVRAGIERGQIRIIVETELWRRLGLVDSDADIQRLYTPAMLASVLRIDIATVRRWQRRGLLRPVRRVRRLPYFDFAQVVVARQLAELVAGGTSAAAIERQWLEWNRRIDNGQPLADYAVVAGGRRLLQRQGNALVETTGQRWFSFIAKEGERQSDVRSAEIAPDESVVALPLTGTAATSDVPAPEALTEMAEELEAQGELAAAADMYRAALAAGGPNADGCFALAELLYRLGDSTAARERYFMAIELDESFVEARANLGCLLAEQGNMHMAVAALEGALRYHPGYADAHYHLAKTLHRLDRRDEAIPHWQSFLRLAPSSPWAAEVQLLLALAGADDVKPD
jgi:tetratricopeptide (TPR) repeat protein